MHRQFTTGGKMKNRRAATLRRAASTALLELEHPTESRVSNAVIIAEAQLKFGNLGCEGLKSVRELWELTEVLEQMHQDYGCSSHATDQGAAGRIRKFMVKHGLQA